MAEPALQKALHDIALLREALAGLVGGGSEAELRQMEAVTRMLALPEDDKAASLRAIRALLETM